MHTLELKCAETAALVRTDHHYDERVLLTRVHDLPSAKQCRSYLIPSNARPRVLFFFAQRDPIRSPRQKQLESARFCYGSDADLEPTRRGGGDLTQIPALSAVMVPLLPLLLLLPLLERVVVVDSEGKAAHF